MRLLKALTAAGPVPAGIQLLALLDDPGGWDAVEEEARVHDADIVDLLRKIHAKIEDA